MDRDLVYPIVDKFIKLINSEYPIYINLILVSLEEKHSYKDNYYQIENLIEINNYYQIEILIEINNYRRIEYFDVYFDQFIDFNSIYEQTHLIIGEMMEQIGI